MGWALDILFLTVVMEETAKPDSGPGREHLRDGSEKETVHDYAHQHTSTPSDDI